MSFEQRRHARTQIFYFFIAPVTAAMVMAIMLISDPIGVIHDRGIRVGILKDMRKQAAGVMNIVPELNGIILGTSMLENTSAREAEDILGGSFANISMSGSSFYERHFALDLILRSQNIKAVIYSLDGITIGQEETPKGSIDRNYGYLYNKNVVDNARAYQNFPIFKCFIKKERKRKKCMSSDIYFDRPNEWASDPEHNVRFGGLDKWFTARNNPQIIDALKSIADSGRAATQKKPPRIADHELDRIINSAKSYIDANILDYVAAHPHTEFHLISPPFSRIRFAQWHQNDPVWAAIHEETLRYLANAADTYKNLHVYGYEDQDFLDDIANYKDTGHYHQSFNSQFLQSIRDGHNKITPDNVDNYLETARNKALAFDLVGLGNQINAYLKAQKN